MSRLNDVRARLADFRKQRQSSGTSSNISDSCFPVDPVEDSAKNKDIDISPCLQELVDQKLSKKVADNSTNQHHEEKHEEVKHQEAKSFWLLFGLKVCVWLLLWGFFVAVGFGMVYMLFSGLLFMVLSLRGGKKRAAGVSSAYSVFNKDFEVIDGTFTAEQFERELRYGPSSVR